MSHPTSHASLIAELTAEQRKVAELLSLLKLWVSWSECCCGWIQMLRTVGGEGTCGHCRTKALIAKLEAAK